jgi:hypothetical protein
MHREVQYSPGCRLELYYNRRGWGLRVSYGFPMCEYIYIKRAGSFDPSGSAPVGGKTHSFSVVPQGFCMSPIRGLRSLVLLSREVGPWWPMCACVACYQMIEQCQEIIEMGGRSRLDCRVAQGV